jgi:sulfatase maturation enzyme AslB (radical SAM superfamily)
MSLLQEKKIKKLIIQPEFTNHCNFRCRFCPHSVYRQQSDGGNRFNRDKGHMSDELFSLVLENAAKYAKRVQIGFFGEPLLHPKFGEYITSFPANRRYCVDLNTNWSLVTRKTMDSLKHLDLVIISLDASYSSLYEELCPGGSVLDLDGRPCRDRHAVLVDKIDYWLRLADHAPTRIVYVVSSVNEHDVKTFVDQWRPKLCLPGDHVLTKSVLSYGGVMRDSHMRENSCAIRSQRWFTVAWNGDCSPCNLDVNLELKAGNLLELRDMRTVVEGDKWHQVMTAVRQRLGICANCFDANNWTENRICRGTSVAKGLATSIGGFWRK